MALNIIPGIIELFYENGETMKNIKRKIPSYELMKHFNELIQ